MPSLPISLRLATRQWLARPLRPILCSLAIAAAVALVVCVGVCFDSLRASIHAGISQLIGGVEIHVRPAQRGTGYHVPAAMLPQLRTDPAIEIASPRLSSQIFLDTKDEHLLFNATGVEVDLERRVRPKYVAEGRYLSGQPNEILIDRAVADTLHVSLNQKVTLNTDAGAKREVTIVGILQQPKIDLLQPPQIYLPLDELQRDVAYEAGYTVIDLKLRDPNADLDATAKRLQDHLGPVVSVKTAITRGAQFTDETRIINLALVVLSMISGTCACLIIGTTLSVGIQERIRQFGQLRCLGASRTQLITFLAADALLLMAGGILIGLLLGVLCAKAIAWYFPTLFIVYQIGFWSLLIASANGILATLLGSLIPAWQVARVTPMEAVRSAATATGRGRIYLAALIGLACLALQLTLWFAIPNRDACFWTYITLGIPLIFVGWCLLGPAAVLLTERLSVHVLGFLFGLRPALLRHTWSRTPWRAGAMIAALMIGVTLFTAVRQRGSGITQALQFPKLPDLFFFSYFSVPYKRIDQVRTKVPDLEDTTCFAIFPAKLKKTYFGAGPANRSDSTLFVAVDPPTFRRMFQLDFIAGDPDTAFAELANGNAVFVSKEYQIARGVKLGDTLPMLSGDRKSVVEFRIVGVVSSTAMDMVKSYFDMRSLVGDASSSSVIGSLGDAKRYFNIDGVNGFAANVKRDRPTEQIIRELKPRLSNVGLMVASAVEIKDNLNQMIDRVVNAMSLIAVAAMGIASLGVANMVIASVRARRFEFGILRAVGAGRGQLVRLLLAEITLISVAAATLGLLAGLHYAFMGSRIDRLLAGFPTTFMQSWPDYRTALVTFAISLGVTVALGWLAAIYPAWRAATVAQRTVLAAGRAG